MIDDDPRPRLRAVDPRRRGRALAAAARQLRTHGVGHVARKALGRARQAYQVGLYDLTPRRLRYRLETIPIDRPIFLLGVQGGGGTILARTLYRHPRAVYASGNRGFWAGPDEIHNCRHTIKDLPESLVHRSAHFFNVDGRLECHPIFGYQRSWLYATDEFLPRYRRTAADADEEAAGRLRRVIRKIVRAYARDPRRARFVDMSQLYTIQVSYLAELLRGCDPRFVLLTRNPYITCARAMRKEYDGFGSRVAIDAERRMRCAIEHWDNSYRSALDDGQALLHVRYEDFMEDPEAVVRRVCAAVELDFDPDQLPRAGQPMPLGSLSEEKWYPLKREENRKYLDSLSPEFVRAMNDRSADLIRRLGYELLG